MYSKSKAGIKLTNGTTPIFETNIGVKQGCVISPTLFNIFLNDLPDIFNVNKSDPVKLSEKRLNCLMYADDIALISKSKEGLQYCLNQLDEYCKTWNLCINTQKTKVMVFNKTGKTVKDINFYIGEVEIDIVKEMKYLGIVFNNNGTFNSAVDNLKDKGTKALFKLFKSFGNLSPNIKIASHLFDAMIKPILIYNSEIWGSSIIDIEKLLSNGTNKTKLYYNNVFEKVQLRWCKYILGVSSKSSNIAVTSELGRYPLLTDIYTNMVKYWLRIKNMDKESLAYDCYMANIEMAEQGQNCWLLAIHKILNKCNMTHQAEHINTGNNYINKAFSKKIKLKLREIYHTQFTDDLFNDSRKNGEGNKLRTFRTFKQNICTENYLHLINDRNIRKNFSRLRTSAHNLPIEKGRHHRPHKIPINERFCEHCDIREIGDEMHTIMSCDKFEVQREIFLRKIMERSPEFIKFNKQEKFKYIMNIGDTTLTPKLIDFLKHIIKIRGDF